LFSGFSGYCFVFFLDALYNPSSIRFGAGDNQLSLVTFFVSLRYGQLFCAVQAESNIMRYGLKTHISILLMGLLVLATGLTSFVILSFWLRETASSFAREKELTLTLLVERQFYRFLDVKHGGDSIAPFIQHTLESSGAELGCMQRDGQSVVCFGEDVDAGAPALKELLGAVQPQTVVRQLSGRQWVGMVPGKRFLDLAVHVTGPGQMPTPVALRFSLEAPYAKIQSLQRYIAVYLSINLIILTVLGFFRVRETILRPVERLLQLTNSYRDEHGVPFLALQESNELAQLYTSMQQMLNRIKVDHGKLQQHVASLEQANEQLRSTREEMIRAEKLSSVGRLAAGLAHEIGNPLGIVQGYLGLISQGDVGASDRHEFCQRAEQELQRVNQLIRQLLDFARPAVGKEQLVDPHVVIDEALALLGPQPLFDGIDIVRRFTANPAPVWCDPGQLLQVLLNCLMNAADAIRAAGVKPGSLLLTTDCSGQGESRRFRLRIADNGCGLHDGELAAAFDPFFTTKAPGRGTGLGLSVSYALLQSMGGTISLANRPEGGAMVTIEIPVIGVDLVRSEE
jgi:signal transduction histidine kinase